MKTLRNRFLEELKKRIEEDKFYRITVVGETRCGMSVLAHDLHNFKKRR